MSFKLLRARTIGQCHFLPLLLLLLHLVPGLLLLPLSHPASASVPTVVTHLPGYDGPLPFNLETGYVGVEEETGTELFYYFVESERSPGTDPMLLWLTGGPRCSVIMGLAFEIGPPRFVWAPYSGGLPELVYNPHSWTKMANILLLDSPVGSGFSHARDPKGYDVGDYSSSLHVQRFLNKWFTDHPQYLSNPFYLAGDSYAGKVIPLIAQDISEGINYPFATLGMYLCTFQKAVRHVLTKLEKKSLGEVQITNVQRLSGYKLGLGPLATSGRLRAATPIQLGSTMNLRGQRVSEVREESRSVKGRSPGGVRPDLVVDGKGKVKDKGTRGTREISGSHAIPRSSKIFDNPIFAYDPGSDRSSARDRSMDLVGNGGDQGGAGEAPTHPKLLTRTAFASAPGQGNIPTMGVDPPEIGNWQSAAAEGLDDLDGILEGEVDMEDDEVLELEEEDEELPPEIQQRWRLLGRYVSQRKPDIDDMTTHFNSKVWRLRMGVNFAPLGKNWFKITFYSEGDYDFVARGGPWIYRGYPLLVTKIQGDLRPSKTVLNTVPL
ncbi:hypothetical protein ACQ4PT_003739 [Festuca glaucescens]